MEGIIICAKCRKDSDFVSLSFLVGDNKNLQPDISEKVMKWRCQRCGCMPLPNERVFRVDEDDYRPKTIKGAIELWLSQNKENAEMDLIISIEKQKLDWLYDNLKHRIIELCDLQNNEVLREACGSKGMNPEAAARVISDALWGYFHPNS